MSFKEKMVSLIIVGIFIIVLAIVIKNNIGKITYSSSSEGTKTEREIEVVFSEHSERV